MVSLYDQLGGHPLKWSKLRGQQWSGSTLPVFHNGQFNCQEMTVDQNLFTVLPSQRYINPGMVLVFEIFLLRGEKSPLDRVVAWGCFPVCNKNFEIIRGKFKLPLLRGFIDDTKEATGRADQADCDIRDYGKKVQSLEIAYDETNDKL